jgi:hypothetical protein
MLAALRVLRRFAGPEGTALGAMIWLVVLIAASFRWMPGSNYLLAWPLLGAALLAYGAWDAAATGAIRLRHAIAVAIGSAAIVFLLIPAIAMSLIAMATAPWMAVPLVAVILALMSPGIDLAIGRIHWSIPAGLAAVAIAVAVVAVLSGGRDAVPRGPAVGVYLASMDAGQAAWLSAEPLVVQSASHRVTSDGPAIDRYTPAWYGDVPRRGGGQLVEMPMRDAAASRITIERDAIDGNARTLALRIVSPGPAPEMSLCLRSTPAIVDASLDDQPLMASPPPTTGASATAKTANTANTATATPAANPTKANPPPCDLRVQAYGQPERGHLLIVKMSHEATLHLELVERTYDQGDPRSGTPPQIRTDDGRVPESLVVSSRFDWPPATTARR